jgi:hypothetical protein
MVQFEEWDSEQGLLIFMVAVSAYMVIEANQWSQTSAIFPQFTGIATLVGSLLLLFREYLPQPLYAVVAGSTMIFEQSEEAAEDQQEERRQEREEMGVTESEELNRPLNPSLFTGILITVYIGASYLFSMLLVTPLFVIAYLVWFRQPWYTILVLTGLSVVLAYAFTTILIVPVDQGIYVDDLLFVFVDRNTLLTAVPLPGVW